MDADRHALETHVSALLGWEKRKRNEKTLLNALAFALLVALAVPLFVTLPRVWSWATPLVLFAVLAPALLLARRWRAPDTARSLAALDSALGSGERITTAWELAQRNDTRAVALLVLRQACDRVKNANVRALFPRRWDKRSFLVLPLFALWVALLVFETRFERHAVMSAEPATLARELRDFARRLQERARGEGLPRTIEVARELEQLAQRAIDNKTPDRAFRRELAAAREKIASDARAGGQASVGGSESQQQLEDLKTELQTARDWLAAPESATRPWEEVLDKLAQLRKQGQWRQNPGNQELTRDEANAFLNKLDKRVAAELDRRAMLQTERQLKQLARPDPGGSRQPGAGGRGKQDDSIEPKLEGQASAPGGKPGAGSADESPLPDYRAKKQPSARSTIGEGSSSTLLLKGRPGPSKSVVAEDEVIARYQRQAEAELDTERIPGELKDAIRSYFLSLDKSKP